MQDTKKRIVFGDLQGKIYKWATYNFPDTKPWQSLLGIIEETGELAHAHLKQSQNIRGPVEKHVKDAQYAIGDIMIFMFNAASNNDIKITDVILPQKLTDGFEQHDFIFHLVGNVNVLCQHPENDQHYVHIIFWLYQYCLVRKWDFENIINSTWEEVQKRDWKTDAQNGGMNNDGVVED